MEFLFTADLAADPAVKIKDTIIPLFHPGIQGDMKFKDILPFLSPATRDYLLPFIGRKFHDALVTQADTEQISLAMAEAVELARHALIYYVVYKAIPAMLGNLSALGFQTMSDRDGTSNGPSQWIYYNTLRNGILQADKLLDHLLVFLDTKLDDPDFAYYSDDPAMQYRRSKVFRQVAQLDEFLHIQGSRRAWNAITPYLNKAEKRQLRPVLGDALFKRLPTLADDPARTPVQEELLEYCRAYIAEVGLLAALPHLSCVISGDGIVIVSNNDGFRQENSSGLVYNQAAISRLRQDATTRAAGALKDLQQFLRINANSFNDYTAPAPAEPTGIINSPGATFI